LEIRRDSKAFVKKLTNREEEEEEEA